MSPDDTPFLRLQPSMSASALDFACNLVDNGHIPAGVKDKLPCNTCVGAKVLEKELLTLSGVEWVGNIVLDRIIRLLPADHNGCVILPLDFLVMHRTSVALGLEAGKDVFHDPVDPPSIEKQRADHVKYLQLAMRSRFDSDNMQIKVKTGDSMVCLCFDGAKHYRLFAVSVLASEVHVCVWDPLDIPALNPPDQQVERAVKVLTSLLPQHAVKLTEAPSMPLLESILFSEKQTDTFSCGIIGMRALVHVVYRHRFATGAGCMRKMRIWLAACLAEGRVVF